MYISSNFSMQVSVISHSIGYATGLLRGALLIGPSLTEVDSAQQPTVVERHRCERLQNSLAQDTENSLTGWQL
jgi:hypothetical protein